MITSPLLSTIFSLLDFINHYSNFYNFAVACTYTGNSLVLCYTKFNYAKEGETSFMRNTHSVIGKSYYTLHVVSRMQMICRSLELQRFFQVRDD